MKHPLGTALAALLLLAGLLLVGSGAQGAQEKLLIWVDVPQKTLTLYRGREAVKSWPVATGAPETPTPIGHYSINSRFSGQMSGFGTCFLGLTVGFGQYGIHGTDKPQSIGSNASHGCVRMRVKDAEELYALVPNWTRVVIEGGPFGEMGDSLRPLQSGDRSSRVTAVQRFLRAKGFTGAWPDGVYGAETEKAVARARKALGLPSEGGVDWALYRALGMTLFE